jgi:crossover junction endodeoxyribonuclease RuvC
MVVLGIDPGTERTGYGVVSADTRGRLSHRAHGVITTSSALAPEKRLACIYTALSHLLEEHRPEVAAIEELFFKQNITTGIGVGQARGVAMLACAHADVPVVGYKPAQVKQGVVGVGRATKQQMQYMVRVLLELDAVPRPDDAADGLALAICHLHTATARGRLAVG